MLKVLQQLQCPLCLTIENIELGIVHNKYIFSCFNCGCIVNLPIDYSLREVGLLLAKRLPDSKQPYRDYEYN